MQLGDPPKIINPLPDDPLWVARLRPGCYVWLSKEQTYARVEDPWDPPEPGTISGRISLCVQPGAFQKWYVRGNGQGFDYKQLIEPCEGSLPDTPPPVPDQQMRQILLMLTKIVRKIGELETRVSALEN